MHSSVRRRLPGDGIAESSTIGLPGSWTRSRVGSAIRSVARQRYALCPRWVPKTSIGQRGQPRPWCSAGRAALRDPQHAQAFEHTEAARGMFSDAAPGARRPAPASGGSSLIPATLLTSSRVAATADNHRFPLVRHISSFPRGDRIYGACTAAPCRLQTPDHVAPLTLATHSGNMETPLRSTEHNSLRGIQ
jgi:hypothetical protein